MTAAATLLGDESSGGRSGLRAHTQPVPFLSPSRGRAEGGARGETYRRYTRRDVGAPGTGGGEDPSGDHGSERDPSPAVSHVLLGPGRASLGGESLGVQKESVRWPRPPVQASLPTSPPESFSSSISICLLTDRGGAVTQPHREPGAHAFTSPGLEGGSDAVSDVGGGAVPSLWRFL